MKKQQKENKSAYTSVLWNSNSLGSFSVCGLDADRGSALGPRGNSSLHTPSTFFQQEKYYPQKKKYTMTKKKNPVWFEEIQTTKQSVGLFSFSEVQKS